MIEDLFGTLSNGSQIHGCNYCTCGIHVPQSKLYKMGAILQGVQPKIHIKVTILTYHTLTLQFHHITSQMTIEMHNPCQICSNRT